MTTNSNASRQLLAGYNHNIPYRGDVYHVQSEFRTTPEACITSQVFLDGRVLCSQKCLIDLTASEPDRSVLEQMKLQHKDVIRRLISGSLGGPALAETAAEKQSSAEVEEFQAPPASLVEVAAAPGHLKLRHSLVRFLRAVDREHPPTDEELPARMRTIVTTIAILTGGTHHLTARKDDLAELLMLRSEALEWLGQEDEGEIDGQRLWQDFSLIAAAMAELNSRQTLVQHDLDIWKRFLQSTENADPELPVSRDQLVSLKSTWGRSLTLDEALEFPTGLKIGHLRELLAPRSEKLEALLEQLRQLTNQRSPNRSLG